MARTQPYPRKRHSLGVEKTLPYVENNSQVSRIGYQKLHGTCREGLEGTNSWCQQHALCQALCYVPFIHDLF